MLIKLKIISTKNFYLVIDDSATVNDLKKKIELEINTSEFELVKENRVLNGKIDLNTYEFSQNDCVELIFKKQKQ